MRLLLSAYACAPRRGSEAGVGWNWAREARRLGHEVVVLTSPVDQQYIEQERCCDAVASDITFFYPSNVLWPVTPGVLPRPLRAHNAVWQMAAYTVARKLIRTTRFDLIHHVTWGGIRDPIFLDRLGVPFVFGPVGGGETAPRQLRDGYSVRGYCIDAIRDVANACVSISPLTNATLSRAMLVATKTEDTKRLVPARYHHKTVVYSEIGIRADEIVARRKVAVDLSRPRLLFAARLLHWKGAHLALRTLECLVRDFPGATLTIVGHGPEERRLHQDVARAGLAHAVNFIQWVDRTKLFDIYEAHDLFVFPSLHDSSGNVVLEALARGLPVICLDLGGPKQFVTESCGRVVTTAGASSRDAAGRISDAIKEVLRTPGLLDALSAGAVARAREFIWEDRVRAFYDAIVPRMAAASKSVAHSIMAPG